jgi:hypothetical protein
VLPDPDSPFEGIQVQDRAEGVGHLAVYRRANRESASPK